MKRVRSGGTAGLAASAEGEQGFWPSYADMMSALALILFFLMLLSYIQNLITGNDLQNTQEVLAETRAKLSATLSEVEDAQAKLKIVSDDLEDAQLTLHNQQEEITQYARRIDEYAKELDAYAEEISGQKETIAKQQTLIDEQKDYLAAANTELRQMRTQMQTIAVLRLSILEQIRDNIIEVMGDATKVSIGDNGNIILSEGVLFDVGKSDIKPDSRAVLDQLIEVFSRFLSDSENAKYVDSIVISGHTDSTGDESSNRELSTDRRAGRLCPVLLRRGIRRDAPRGLQRHGRGTRRQPAHRGLHDPQGRVRAQDRGAIPGAGAARHGSFSCPVRVARSESGLTQP